MIKVNIKVNATHQAQTSKQRIAGTTSHTRKFGEFLTLIPLLQHTIIIETTEGHALLHSWAVRVPHFLCANNVQFSSVGHLFRSSFCPSQENDIRKK